MFTRDMLEFMMDIRFNNNKEFMAAHRQEYISKVRTPYYQLIESLAPAMLKIDPEMEVQPGKVLSRIFRDTRFSRDKSPYRDHHWIAFRHRGEPRDQAVMFWFEIRLEAVSWGLGYWGENKPAMELLRQRIISGPRELQNLVPILKEHDFELEGSKYQRINVPENLPEPLNEWYRHKELYFVKRNIIPDWAFEPGLENRLINDYLAMTPFYRLLRGLHILSQ